ncbi:hypothetical protein F5X98DRAFT_334479 [Xylaria grammica]|nr:hypothetical protein F5X98DRAFT_334479 [Xylaria grammica]
MLALTVIAVRALPYITSDILRPVSIAVRMGGVKGDMEPRTRRSTIEAVVANKRNLNRNNCSGAIRRMALIVGALSTDGNQYHQSVEKSDVWPNDIAIKNMRL